MFAARAPSDTHIAFIPPIPPCATTTAGLASIQSFLSEGAEEEAHARNSIPIPPPPSLDAVAREQLQSRFRALFLWPAVLSLTAVSASPMDSIGDSTESGGGSGV
eukprot:Opistho-2@73704